MPRQDKRQQWCRKPGRSISKRQNSPLAATWVQCVTEGTVCYQGLGQLQHSKELPGVGRRMPPKQGAVWKCICHNLGHSHVGQQHELLHQLVGLPLDCTHTQAGTEQGDHSQVGIKASAEVLEPQCHTVYALCVHYTFCMHFICTVQVLCMQCVHGVCTAGG